MIPDRLFRLLVGVIVLAFLVGCLLHQSVYSAFTTAATAGALFMVAWDRYLWRWKPFCYLDWKPDLRGTWQGRLNSDYRNPETGEHHLNIESYLVIRQTYSKINGRLLTVESGSISLSANLFADGDGLFTLATTFRNTPRALLRERSAIGYGGMLLNILGTPIHKLEGEYWTERKTKGELVFTARAAKLAEDFEQAQRMEFKALTCARKAHS